jgi:TM2 domain-containing membrane protein YozV
MEQDPIIHQVGLTGKDATYYAVCKKNMTMAYILWLCLGTLGAHRAYLNDYTGFIVYIIGFSISFIIPLVFIALFVLWAVDIFYTYQLCNKVNLKLARMLRDGV